MVNYRMERRGGRPWTSAPIAAALQALTPLACLAATACAPGPPGPTGPGAVVVFAAASLRDVMTQLGTEFELRQGTPVQFNFAGSNVLAQQILAAPRADLFLSADLDWIDVVEEHGVALDGPRRSFLGNRLVVVGRADAQLTIDEPGDLARAPYRHLALANPEGVPAGRYARAWLEGVRHGGGRLWDALLPRVAPTSDVRAALALVASSPGVVGIVYATDLAQSEGVVVLYEPPPAEQPSIVYGSLRLAREGAPRAAGAASSFEEFLFSADARRIYVQHGFALPSP